MESDVLSSGDPMSSSSSVDLTKWGADLERESQCDLSLIGRIERLGRFRLLRELGRGGCGVVYLADDEQLERQVAIKVPGEASQFFTKLRKRLLREAQAAAVLQHQNIAKSMRSVSPMVCCLLYPSLSMDKI